jgi:hypothetical protein
MLPDLHGSMVLVRKMRDSHWSQHFLKMKLNHLLRLKAISDWPLRAAKVGTSTAPEQPRQLTRLPASNQVAIIGENLWAAIGHCCRRVTASKPSFLGFTRKPRASQLPKNKLTKCLSHTVPAICLPNSRYPTFPSRGFPARKSGRNGNAY